MSLDNIDDLLAGKEEAVISKPVQKESVEVQETPQSVPRQAKKRSYKIPDFNDLLKFCEKYMEGDYEIEQFYKHTIPRRMHKEKFQEDRGGGGWSGAVKATINILRKMKEKGEL